MEGASAGVRGIRGGSVFEAVGAVFGAAAGLVPPVAVSVPASAGPALEAAAVAPAEGAPCAVAAPAGAGRAAAAPGGAAAAC